MQRPDCVAGAGGFEPPHGGIKIRKSPLICKGFPVSCCICGKERKVAAVRYRRYSKQSCLLVEEKRANPSNYALVVLSEGAE